MSNVFNGNSQPLIQDPPFVESVNGLLNITLTLEEATISNDVFTMTTRTFNGTLPGPTLILSAGDTLNIQFINQLPSDEGRAYVHNAISAPNEANLHFHGLHVSGEAPSDDVELVIAGGGESYNYSTTLPDNHHPGLHWLHPHRHGSTTLQVFGGAAAAIVVRDEWAEDDNVPDIYQAAEPVLMFVQPMYFDELRGVARESQDSLFQVETTEETVFVVNGQVRPFISASAGDWIRLRLVFAAGADEILRITIPNCDMQLIAKDGIYLPTVPRSIDEAIVLQGGRADILVSCPEPSSSYEILQDGNRLLATVDTDATPSVEKASLPIWTLDYPEYLQDLQSRTVLPNCSCPTDLGDGVNGFAFDENFTTHTYQLGQVVERRIDAGNHPYHQHVYPFQLQANYGTSGYYQAGDWHDVIGDTGAVRYLPTVFASKLMVHCHRLEHEDTGMMGIERHGDYCECGPVTNEQETWVIIAIAVGAALLLCCLCGGTYWYCRRQNSEDGGMEDSKASQGGLADKNEEEAELVDEERNGEDAEPARDEEP